MIKKIIFIQFIIVIWLSVFLAAESVDDIINNVIKAMGGLEKIKAVKTAVIDGRTYQGAMEIPIMIKIKKPNKIRIEVIIQGQTMVQAYDGSVGWQIIPFLGTTEPENSPEEETKMLKMQADLDGPIVDYKEKGNKVELMGEEDMEGNKVYKLKLTMKEGDVHYIYIDKESYVPLKRSMSIKKGDSEIIVESIFSDYKSVEGVLIPFTTENKVGGQLTGSFVIGEIKFNVDLDDSIFTKPKSTAPEKEKSSVKK
jgi:outer membrane lipoprotein-sorting protein